MVAFTRVTEKVIEIQTSVVTGNAARLSGRFRRAGLHQAVDRDAGPPCAQVEKSVVEVMPTAVGTTPFVKVVSHR